MEITKDYLLARKAEIEKRWEEARQHLATVQEQLGKIAADCAALEGAAQNVIQLIAYMDKEEENKLDAGEGNTKVFPLETPNG